MHPDMLLHVAGRTMVVKDNTNSLLRGGKSKREHAMSTIQAGQPHGLSIWGLSVESSLCFWCSVIVVQRRLIMLLYLSQLCIFMHLIRPLRRFSSCLGCCMSTSAPHKQLLCFLRRRQ
jgi:hypothetical protein